MKAGQVPGKPLAGQDAGDDLRQERRPGPGSPSRSGRTSSAATPSSSRPATSSSGGASRSPTRRASSRATWTAIMIRTFAHADVEELAKLRHGAGDQRPHRPAPSLPDPRRPAHGAAAARRLRGKKVAWIGDGNNMANSWLDAAGAPRLRAPAGLPRGLRARSRRSTSAAPKLTRISITERPGGGRGRGRTWSPPTCGPRWARRARRRCGSQAFKGYVVDEELMSAAEPDAIFLHCLPAHRGEEVTRGGDRGAAVAGVGRGGEPPARPEGAAATLIGGHNDER